MPEIWLNYGPTDVVLDIRAENLDEQLEGEGNILTDAQIEEKLASFDVTKSIELVVQNNSKYVQKIIAKLFEKCEQKSSPKPKILAEKNVFKQVKDLIPDGCNVSEFEKADLDNSNLVFIGEMEFDGLFGFETIATRLLRKFGNEQMLSAFQKRKGNLPSLGEDVQSIEEAKKFSDLFEISAIEIAATSKGIVDLAINHPSSTMNISKTFLSSATKQAEKHRTMIISTGKDSSNDSLGKSLTSLWNCNEIIKDNGLAVLLAECNNGIGSEALLQYIEERMSLERLRKPAKYVNGMEDLLFLNEIQKRFQVALISVLPQFYAKRLNLLSFTGIKQAMDHILKIQGMKQKVAIVSDGARLLLKKK